MGQKNETHRTKGSQAFLNRLATDTSANTLAIAAASLIPLLAMVGGGIDASRYYMAETRLQAACDAGALAARREMADDNFTSVHRQTGENFFDQNYSDGLFGTENLQRQFSGTVDGEVNGTASGKMPTSIMAAFGYADFDLSVDCTADINISNSDIMFVLDVTGSMGRTPDGTSFPGGASDLSRLGGLRSAVMSFYDTVEATTSPSAQVRYGIVPYSTNVNVGQAILDENPDWLAQAHTYQTRRGEFVPGPYVTTGTTYERTSGAFNWQFQGEVSETQFGLTSAECDAAIATRFDIFEDTDDATWTQVSQSGTDPRSTVYTGTVTFQFYWDVGNSSYRASDGRCRIRQDYWHYDAEADITVSEEREEEFQWVYGEHEWNLATLYDDNAIELPLGWNNAPENVNWDGCIEEAQTAEGATNFDPVPTDAFDLDINLAPASAAERWKPVLFGAVWRRELAGTTTNTQAEITQTDPSSSADQRKPNYVCPTEAFRLTEISRTNLQAYVNSLTASGNTYHDVGMIWGARFITPNGIFAAANSAAPNGDAIARHIVFMTDGTLEPFNETYNLYGVEWWDRRISTDGSANLAANHAERFQVACSAARQENISVWVVAFGTALSQNLIDCATPGRAFSAADSQALADSFEEIAQRIAALRLTQ